MALGLAATPAQTALLSSESPALFFPSMNKSMWRKASTQRHVSTLRADGHTVVDPREGPVYEIWKRENVMGVGLLPPPEAIEAIIGWLEHRHQDHERV